MPLPPITVQNEIDAVLSAVGRKLDAEEARRRALDTLFKTLLDSLMTGKVRVPYENIESVDGSS